MTKNEISIKVSYNRWPINATRYQAYNYEKGRFIKCPNCGEISNKLTHGHRVVHKCGTYLELWGNSLLAWSVKD